MKPGPPRPGNYKSGSSNRGANGFHTLSDRLMVLLQNVLGHDERDLAVDFFCVLNYLLIFRLTLRVSELAAKQRHVLPALNSTNILQSGTTLHKPLYVCMKMDSPTNNLYECSKTKLTMLFELHEFRLHLRLLIS